MARLEFVLRVFRVCPFSYQAKAWWLAGGTAATLAIRRRSFGFQARCVSSLSFSHSMTFGSSQKAALPKRSGGGKFCFLTSLSIDRSDIRKIAVTSSLFKRVGCVVIKSNGVWKDWVRRAAELLQGQYELHAQLRMRCFSQHPMSSHQLFFMFF